MQTEAFKSASSSPYFASLLRPEAASAANCHAIDHVAVFTTAPDDAVALYAEALGIRLALDREFGGTRMLFFRTGKVTLEVIQRELSPAEQDRFYGMTYRVADLDGAHARLSAAGFTVDAPRGGNKPGTRVFAVRDGTCGVPTLILRDPSRDG